MRIITLFTTIAMTVTTCADMSTGSGVFVNSNAVLTAYHVVDGAERISVIDYSGKESCGHVVRFDKKKDWAIVKVDTTVNDYAAVDFGCSVSMGDKVYVLGFPATSILGRNVKYTDGVISAIGFAGDVDILQMTAPIQPGNSGGPVFDSNGRLIAIVTASVDPEKFFKETGGALPQGVNFALKLKGLPDAEFMDAYRQKTQSIRQNEKVTCFITCEKSRSADILTTKIVQPPSLENQPTVPEKEIIKINPVGEGVVAISSLFGYQLGSIVQDVNDGTDYCIKEVSVPVGVKDFQTIKLYCTPITHKLYRIEAVTCVSGRPQPYDAWKKDPLEEKVRLIAEKYKGLYGDKYGIKFRSEYGRSWNSIYEKDGVCIYRETDPLCRYWYVSYPDYPKTGEKNAEYRLTIFAERFDDQKVPKEVSKRYHDIIRAKYKAMDLGYKPERICTATVRLLGEKEDAIRAQEEFELRKPEREKEAEQKRIEAEKRKKYQELL